MSPAALKTPVLRALLVLGILYPLAAAGSDPHLDPGTVPAGCQACHRGHGASGSPMMERPQAEVCLDCHESANAANAPGERPRQLGSALAQNYTHPLDRRGFSRREISVTCTSCHSPHRAMSGRGLERNPGGQLPSPRDPRRFEFELCESCHGHRGGPTGTFVDIARLLDPFNVSYHPVEAPARGRSPSVLPGLSGQSINCTDCHGNSDPRGPRGPHGSGIPKILRANYLSAGSSRAPASAYALCFSCHRADMVLSDRSPFPLHDLHVNQAKASCAECHDAHGSTGSRALIHFGTYTSPARPAANGVLRFDSSAPGSGTCYLSCHGKDHDPESYGLAFGDDLKASPLTPRGNAPTLQRSLRDRLGNYLPDTRPKKPLKRRKP